MDGVCSCVIYGHRGPPVIQTNQLTHLANRPQESESLLRRVASSGAAASHARNDFTLHLFYSLIGFSVVHAAQRGAGCRCCQRTLVMTQMINVKSSDDGRRCNARCGRWTVDNSDPHSYAKVPSIEHDTAGPHSSDKRRNRVESYRPNSYLVTRTQPEVF